MCKFLTSKPEISLICVQHNLRVYKFLTLKPEISLICISDKSRVCKLLSISNNFFDVYENFMFLCFRIIFKSSHLTTWLYLMYDHILLQSLLSDDILIASLIGR